MPNCQVIFTQFLRVGVLVKDIAEEELTPFSLAKFWNGYFKQGKISNILAILSKNVTKIKEDDSCDTDTTIELSDYESFEDVEEKDVADLYCREKL